MKPITCVQTWVVWCDDDTYKDQTMPDSSSAIGIPVSWWSPRWFRRGEIARLAERGLTCAAAVRARMHVCTPARGEGD